jgi:hypothetical protein
MSHLFDGFRTFNPSINHWNVSNVTNMSHMFQVALSFNQPEWWVSNVTAMSYMFFGSSNVTDISGMFYGASSFNQFLHGIELIFL